MIRQIIAYKDNFVNFYNSQETKVQLKIEYVLDLVRFENQVQRNFSSNWKIRMEYMKLGLSRLLKVFGFYVFSTKEN